MSRIALILLLVLAPDSLAAQALSANDCAEIRAAYGIIPQGCPAVADVAAPVRALSEPAPSDRESHIFFPHGGSRVDPAGAAQIERLAAVLESPPVAGLCIRLTGHSDVSGAAAVNVRISRRRAEAVATALRPLMADNTRITEVRGLGEAEPLPSIDPTSSWQRRVAIELGRCPPV